MFSVVSSCEIKHDNDSYSIVKISLQSKTQISVSIHQHMERFFQETEYKSSNMRLMVVQKTKDAKRPYKYIFGGYKATGDDIYLDSNRELKKGTYYAFIQCDWENSFVNRCTFRVIGNDVAIEEVNIKNFENLLEESVKDFARNNIKEIRNPKSDQDIEVKYYVGPDAAGYGFFFYKNNSEVGTTLIEKVKFDKMEGIKLLYETDDQKYSYIEVKPGNEGILLLKRQGNECSTNYSYQSFLNHTPHHLVKLCTEEGKETLIVNKNSQDKISYFLNSHDFGYTFVFKNKSKTSTLDAYWTFREFQNLKLSSQDSKISNGELFWKFTVGPKS